MFFLGCYAGLFGVAMFGGSLLGFYLGGFFVFLLVIFWGVRLGFFLMALLGDDGGSPLGVPFGFLDGFICWGCLAVILWGPCWGSVWIVIFAYPGGFLMSDHFGFSLRHMLGSLMGGSFGDCLQSMWGRHGVRGQHESTLLVAPMGGARQWQAITLGAAGGGGGGHEDSAMGAAWSHRAWCALAP